MDIGPSKYLGSVRAYITCNRHVLQGAEGRQQARTTETLLGLLVEGSPTCSLMPYEDTKVDMATTLARLCCGQTKVKCCL